jgi:serine/threonine protein kinase
MLECLRQMHEKGYIHQDVKPDNFMISLRDHKVRILDMGLVMEYMRDGGHKALGRYGFQGTPHYGSMSGLKGYTLSRRDDLEQLGYTIMYLIDQANVPWLSKDNKQAILDEKTAFSTAPVVNLKFQGIREYINKAAAVDYVAEPEYAEFHEVLLHMMDNFH